MIAAAGSGQRLGAGGPKAFVEVAGRPLLEWSLRSAAAAHSVEAIVVAAPAADIDRAGGCIEAAGIGEFAEAVAGGATRAESVALAMRAVATEFVAIHDAARPLASAELFDRLAATLDADPKLAGAIAAAPIVDTVKRATEARGGSPPHDGRISGTEDRSQLWAAQTPQLFRVVELASAQEQARREGTLEAATDEAALLEWIGRDVALVDPGEANPKLTVPDDLSAIEALLRDRTRV